jgi:hypothetical protein
MHMQSLVMWGALAVTIGIPVYRWRRRRNVLSGFQALLAEKGFAARAASPVAALSEKNPPDGFHFSAAYDGSINGVTTTLLLLKRTEAVVVQGTSIQNQTIYIGAYVRGSTVNDDFLGEWRRRLQGKRDDIVHVSQPAEGGALLVWKGTPSRAHVQAHLMNLAGTLAQRPK